MSNLIDELISRDAQRSPQIVRAEEIRLRNVEVRKAKLPRFWWMLLREVETLCAELGKAFPNNEARRCTVEKLGHIDGFRIGSAASPPRHIVQVTWNVHGLTFDYTETVQKELYQRDVEEAHGEIRITVRPDDEALVAHYHELECDSPQRLAEALVRYVIRE